MPDLKTFAIWLLGVLLVAALLATGYEHTQVLAARADTATAREQLTAEKLDRSQVNEERSRAALRYMEKVAVDQQAHAVTQQGISNELTVQTKLRRDADAAVLALNARMRDGAAALRAALARRDAQANAATGQHPGDRPETVNELFADGGQLLARSGGLVASCRSRVAQRDAEVAALRSIIDNDRALFLGVPDTTMPTSSLLPLGRQRLPNAMR